VERRTLDGDREHGPPDPDLLSRLDEHVLHDGNVAEPRETREAAWDVHAAISSGRA